MTSSWPGDNTGDTFDDPTAQPISDPVGQPYQDDADTGPYQDGGPYQETEPDQEVVGPNDSDETVDPTDLPEQPTGQPTDQPAGEASGGTDRTEAAGIDATTDPAAAGPAVEAVTAGPSTPVPTGADRAVLPGVTDVAADLGHALGVGTDEFGLVEVEVNGLMGVRVHLEPGLVPHGPEQAGHWLAAALEDARREVVGRLHDHFRGNDVTARWLDIEPDPDGAAPAGGQRTSRPRQRVVSSPDHLVSVVVAPDGAIESVVVAADHLDLAVVAESFVRAAESALQGNSDDEPGLDLDVRLAQFDGAMVRIDKSLGELDQQLDAVLKRL